MDSSPTVPRIALRNGTAIPQIGFGLWGFDDESVQPVLADVFKAGYRMIDTGDEYHNERGVGLAIRASGLPRDELFVTTKVYDASGYDATMRAFDASLGRLGLDHLDLYLIHWPMGDRDQTADAWRAMERLLADGRVRAVGVSNFYADDLRHLLARARTAPLVNQIELHPWCSQAAQRALDREHGIVTQAWGPLGRGRGLLESGPLRDVADRHGRSPAQVALRWQVQLGVVSIPKSTDPRRMAENLEVFDFTLDEQDLAALAVLDDGRLVGPYARPF